MHAATEAGSSGWHSRRPAQPRRMPTVLCPSSATLRTTALMLALSPGTSPPPVSTPIRMWRSLTSRARPTRPALSHWSLSCVRRPCPADQRRACTTAFGVHDCSRPRGPAWQQETARSPGSSSSTSPGSWPGPTARSCSRDLGARVVKVERPRHGDDARSIGPFVHGQSAYFASLNRGKESIDLDLKAEDDRRVLEALLDRADVLVENFRPGTMSDLGYPWEVVHERWPRLVQASVSGFGQTGPDERAARLRHGRAGPRRGDEHHRPRRRRADAGRHLDRRHHGRSVRRHRRDRRPPPAHGHRRGLDGRRGDARLPGRHPRERHRPVRGDRCRARARSARAIRRSRRSERSAPPTGW